jgi:hypothetical protein
MPLMIVHPTTALVLAGDVPSEGAGSPAVLVADTKFVKEVELPVIPITQTPVSVDAPVGPVTVIVVLMVEPVVFLNHQAVTRSRGFVPGSKVQPPETTSVQLRLEVSLIVRAVPSDVLSEVAPKTRIVSPLVMLMEPVVATELVAGVEAPVPNPVPLVFALVATAIEDGFY